jgi:hypothetical protein
MAQTSFEMDQSTADIMDQLKRTFGVKTNAQVIRKALALARVAANAASPDNTITIVDSSKPDRVETKVLLQA